MSIEEDPKGELTIVCKAHRRRCYVEPPGDVGGAQIRHETHGRAPGDVCVGSAKFAVRWEFEYDREAVLSELVGEFERQEGEPRAYLRVARA